MITKEYLQQELEKRIGGYKSGVETTTDNIIAEMKSILVLVDALEEPEHLADARKTSPNDLDDAAHKYAWEKQEHHIDFDGDEYFDYGTRYDAFIAGAEWGAERFAKIVRANLTKIDKSVQSQFEQLYMYLTGDKMYGGYND